MTTTSLADAKNRLSEIVAMAQSTHERTTITKNGKPVAVLMSVDDLQSLEETLWWTQQPTTRGDLIESEITQRYGFYFARQEMLALLEARRDNVPDTDIERLVLGMVEQRMGAAAYARAIASITSEIPGWQPW